MPSQVGQSTPSNNDLYDESIKILTRQCARWTTAAQQDQNPIVATLHANYGTGYLWALQDTVDNDTFNKVTGLDFAQFEASIVKVQDAVTLKLMNSCPNLTKGMDPYLLKISKG